MDALVLTTLCLLLNTVVIGQFLGNPTNTNPCPHGFSLHGQSCYRFIDMSESWINAWTYCSTMSAHPVSIESHEENTYLTELVANKTRPLSPNAGPDLQERIWTSGTNIQGTLMWKGPEKEVKVTFWDIGEPVTTSPDVFCIMKLRDGWHSDQCFQERRFVCEKELDGLVIPYNPNQTDGKLPPKTTMGPKISVGK